jgi:hypothetical protein
MPLDMFRTIQELLLWQVVVSGASASVSCCAVRFTKGEGGVPAINPYEVKHQETFHSAYP